MPDSAADGFHRPDREGYAVAFEIDEENGTRSVVDRAALPPETREMREIPNLAECHGCGLRINIGNCQDRLRTLNSEWRIVLLCGKCYGRSVRGELCTYCLSEVAEEERFKCGKCFCSVHWDCVSKFSDLAPWSYFDWRSSSVCVDCWLPSKVQKLRSVQGGRKRIGDNFVDNGKRLVNSGEKDVDYGLDKRADQLVAKPPVVLKGSEKSLGKAPFVKAGIGKENRGVSLVASGELGQKGKGIDDAELAFQLHRVMNSSCRISRNPLSRNHSHVKKVNTQGGRNVSSVKTSAFGLRNCVDGGCLSAFESKDEGTNVALKEGQRSCSSISVDTESFSLKELDLPKPELKFTYARRQCMSKNDGKPNRYMFKYSRKRSRLFELVVCKYTYLYDRSTYESENSSTGIVLHSSIESRNFPDSCILSLPVSDGANGSSQNYAY